MSPSSPKSYTWTMFGWLSRATACASRTKRIEKSLAVSSSSWLLRMVLIATWRCELRVERLVDDAHRPLAEHLLDLVATKGLRSGHAIRD